MGIFKRLFCQHTEQIFIRNLYGDQIIDHGYKRSLWKCSKCDAVIPKDDLHIPGNETQKGGA